jgi:hypothetical protein
MLRKWLGTDNADIDEAGQAEHHGDGGSEAKAVIRHARFQWKKADSWRKHRDIREADLMARHDQAVFGQKIPAPAEYYWKPDRGTGLMHFGSGGVGKLPANGACTQSGNRHKLGTD